MSALEQKKTELAQMRPVEIVGHPRVVEMFKKMWGQEKAFAVFEREKAFAVQALTANPKLMQTAEGNKMSLYTAIINCAINKLSLNPQLGLSYLVPRGSAVTWQVSYRGKIEILRNAGAIIAVKAAEVVYQGDEFIFNKGQVERHVPVIPRPQGGRKLGAYVTAIIPDGMGGHYEKDVFMDYAAIMKRKEKALTKNVWTEWEDEMMLKTVVNQLFKMLPKTERILELEQLAPGSVSGQFQDEAEPEQISVTTEEAEV